MKTIALDNKKRLIIGLGQTGLSVARYLSNLGQSFKVMDTRDIAPGHSELNEFAPGALINWNAETIFNFDELVVSPGVAISTPEIAEAINKGISVVGDIELFAQAVTIPVIAITGSNGKSTVTDLVGKLINASGKKALVGGNIGVPALELLEQDVDIIVLELSSFQLETTKSLTPIAATVLNLSEDHLDRYRGFQEYVKAKLSIFDKAITNVINCNAEYSLPSSENVISFGLASVEEKVISHWQFDSNKKKIMNVDKKIKINAQELNLKGEHNCINVAAAFALLQAAGIEITDAVISCAKQYRGLAHRCEFVAVKNGVTYINDSKATNVGATVAAIDGFYKQFNSIILIAGGDAKGADLSQLSDTLNNKVDAVVCYGKDGKSISDVTNISVHLVSTLQSALAIAEKIAKEGDLVLLSPACASLDMFENYIERGNAFKKLVEVLDE